MTSDYDSPGFRSAFWAGLALAIPRHWPPAHATAGALRERVSERLGGVARTLTLWYERWRQRRAAMELDHRMLKDIGLTRLDIVAEAEKPFWRA